MGGGIFAPLLHIVDSENVEFDCGRHALGYLVPQSHVLFLDIGEFGFESVKTIILLLAVKTWRWVRYMIWLTRLSLSRLLVGYPLTP